MSLITSHEELVAELPKLEKLSNAARLKHAKKRRQKQLKRWQEWIRQERATNGSILRKRSENKIAIEDAALLNDLVTRNDIIGVQKLLQKGLTPNNCNADGLTPLHKCCIDNTVELAEIILEHGAELNARDIEGWTPLHAASATGNLAMINLLLDEGASLVAINHDDKMPVDVACDGDIRYILHQRMIEAGYTEDVLEYIRISVPKTMLADLKDSVKSGRSLNIQDRYGATALHVAAANGYTEVMEFIFAQSDVQLDIQDNEGWTPFHAAVCWEQKEAMKMLAEKGANLDVKNLRGETAYAIAEEGDIKQLVLELKGQYGEPQEVEIEKEPEDDLEPVRRPRRLSVKRMRQQDKEALTMQSTKSEAEMRRQSIAQKELEGGSELANSSDQAILKEIIGDEEDESVRLLSITLTERDRPRPTVQRAETLELDDTPFKRREQKSILKAAPQPATTYNSSTSPGSPTSSSRGSKEGCCVII